MDERNQKEVKLAVWMKEKRKQKGRQKMWMKYQMILTGVFLLLCTYTDLRYRCIYRKIVLGMIIFSIMGHLVNCAVGQSGHAESAGEAAVSVLLGIIPGAVCFLISFLTREAFGYGDCMTVTACGVALGAEKTVELLTAGFLFSSVWAVFLFVFRKAGLKKEFPFLPFLSMAYVLEFLFGRFHLMIKEGV